MTEDATIYARTTHRNKERHAELMDRMGITSWGEYLEVAADIIESYVLRVEMEERKRMVAEAEAWERLNRRAT